MIPNGHILIFIRHGKRIRNKADRDEHLSEHGMAMAQRTGEWLRNSGFSPSVLLSTPWHRTRETAAVIQGQCADPKPPILRIESGPASLARLEFLAENQGSRAAIVAHHTTQQFLESAFNLEPTPRGQNAMVYVMEKRGDTWRCIARHPGED